MISELSLTLEFEADISY